MKVVCDEIFVEFEWVVGMYYLCVMYINDLKGKLVSCVDCYYFLGMGEIGWECFEYIV